MTGQHRREYDGGRHRQVAIAMVGVLILAILLFILGLAIYTLATSPTLT